MGIYELYNGRTIAIVDAPACGRPEHRAGQQVDDVPGIVEVESSPGARD